MPHLTVGLCPALTNEVLDSLSSVGLKNAVDFVASDLEHVTKRINIPFKDLVAIRRVVLAKYSGLPQTGSQVYNDFISSVAILKTGCSSIDGFLDGGLYTGELTEIIGTAASGKTQLCLSTTTNIIKTTKSNVLYIDTCSSFECARLEEILIEGGMNEETIASSLQKVRCCQAFDIFELLDICVKLKDEIGNQGDDFAAGIKLLVIDSVTAVLSPILGGMQFEGLSMMIHLARVLKQIASEFSIAVLMTNNAVYGEGGSVRAALGKQWQSVPNTRIYLDKLPKEKGLEQCSPRQASLLKSSKQVVSLKAVPFTITKNGLY